MPFSTAVNNGALTQLDCQQPDTRKPLDICGGTSGGALPLSPTGVFASRRSTVALAGLPLLAKILIGLVAPPIVTIVCWLIGPRLVGARRERTRERNRVEFWLMLIAAYLIFSLALGGSHFFAGNDRVDPSSLLVQ